MTGGLTATRLIGAAVTGCDGGKLGSIADVMIAAEGGAVLYVVLAAGGVLGVGERLFAVPWRALHVEPDGTLSASFAASAVEDEPGFDKDRWPAEADNRLA